MAPVLELMLKPGNRFSIKDIPAASLAKLAVVMKAGADRQVKDWPNLCRYAPDNAAVSADRKWPRVVFLGDSITEIWKTADPAFFDGAVMDRGISGQTSPQILLRFYADVVALHPKVVHIIAGTNDVAENTGPVSDETVVDNIRAMIDMAQANRIKVVLGSIPPTKDLGKPNLKPATRIPELNRQLRTLAAARHVVFIDYYAPLSDAEGGFQVALSNDGVHPNRAGYAIMKPLAQRAIANALRR